MQRGETNLERAGVVRYIVGARCANERAAFTELQSTPSQQPFQAGYDLLRGLFPVNALSKKICQLNTAGADNREGQDEDAKHWMSSVLILAFFRF